LTVVSKSGSIEWIKNFYYLMRYLMRLIKNFPSVLILNVSSLILKLTGEELNNALGEAPIRSLQFMKNALKLNHSKPKRYSILSFPYGKSFNNFKTIQAHLHRKIGFLNLRVSRHKYFDTAVRRFILENKPPLKRIIENPVYTLPYYNTHFGHCTGELLGSIIYWGEEVNVSRARKLLIPNMGRDIQHVISSVMNTDYLDVIEPDIFLNFELILKDAIILPLIHPHQNLNFLRQKLTLNYPYDSNIKLKKVFVTSMRSERISNIFQVQQTLIEFGFTILSGYEFGITENSVIRNAEILIIEDASLSHLAIMHRCKPYFVLSPTRSRDYNAGEYFGGYIFNEVDPFLRIEVPCETITSQKHVMSSQLIVDIDQLLQVVCAAEGWE